MSSVHATARPNGILAVLEAQAARNVIVATKPEQKPEQKPDIPPPNDTAPPTLTPEERAALEAQAAREKIQCLHQRTAMKRQWRGNLIFPTKEEQDAYDELEKLIADCK